MIENLINKLQDADTQWNRSQLSISFALLAIHLSLTPVYQLLLCLWLHMCIFKDLEVCGILIYNKFKWYEYEYKFVFCIELI